MQNFSIQNKPIKFGDCKTCHKAIIHSMDSVRCWRCNSHIHNFTECKPINQYCVECDKIRATGINHNVIYDFKDENNIVEQRSINLIGQDNIDVSNLFWIVMKRLHKDDIKNILLKTVTPV